MCVIWGRGVQKAFAAVRVLWIFFPEPVSRLWSRHDLYFQMY